MELEGGGGGGEGSESLSTVCVRDAGPGMAWPGLHGGADAGRLAAWE